MVSIEKLLLIMTNPSISFAEKYLVEDGFILNNCIEGSDIWAKTLKMDKAETISLMKLDGIYNSISYLFFDENTYKVILEDAINKLDFKYLEDDEAKILEKDGLILLLIRHEQTPFKIFSVKLGRRNKDNEITEVIMHPPKSQ